MPIDLEEERKNIKSKISSFKDATDSIKNAEKIKKNVSGNNLQESFIDKITTFSENVSGKTQSFNTKVKNQYEELIELFSLTNTENTTVSNNDSVNFLLDQILNASKNTIPKITNIFINELISTAGCSEEQLYNGCNENDTNCNNKIFIPLKQIDLFRILYLNPLEGNNSLLYENKETSLGDLPFSLNRELYKRLQNPGVSFKDEYGDYYKGGSGNSLMDFKYVTSYTDENFVLQTGDFIEVTLINNSNISYITEFLVDYFKSINLFSLDELLINLMNSVTNYLNIGLNRSEEEILDVSKFKKIINRILGLCFDENQEINVSGNAKTSELDSLNENFFTIDNIDLRNIENELNDIKQGVMEFESCGNVKLPVNTEFILSKMENLRKSPINRQVDEFINTVNTISNDPTWESQGVNGINLNVSIKTDLLNNIPLSLINTILSPKSIFGIMIILNSVKSKVINGIEDLETFKNNMKSFLVNITSKITSLFIEELFKLLKKNIFELVRLLLRDIFKEKKERKNIIITSVLSTIVNLGLLIDDWRKCKSVVDEILNLLSLSLPNINDRIPNFALALSEGLDGFSTTRATINTVRGLQSLGLPTGDLPSGAPNFAVAAISEQIKAVYKEQIENGKTEIFIPPLAVVALGGGTTTPGRGIGKSY